MIATAKIFTTGNSQAIRLPKAFRLRSEEVWISKSRNGIITIHPKTKKDETGGIPGRFALNATYRRVFAAPRRCAPS
ncbi:MAG: hypothetical protein IPO43_18185 [Rhodoferax sp.]|nr:hypothetical protein [Rhodoferax sp.]